MSFRNANTPVVGRTRSIRKESIAAAAGPATSPPCWLVSEEQRQSAALHIAGAKRPIDCAGSKLRSRRVTHKIVGDHRDSRQGAVVRGEQHKRCRTIRCWARAAQRDSAPGLNLRRDAGEILRRASSARIKMTAIALGSQNTSRRKRNARETGAFGSSRAGICRTWRPIERLPETILPAAYERLVTAGRRRGLRCLR